MQHDDRGGLIIWIQNQPGPARLMIFILFVVGIATAMFSTTAFLFWLNLRSLPRVEPVALPETGVSIREFVRLDDPAAYPGALAVAPDGTLYTGSYASGVLWRVDPEGQAYEIPNSRGTVGSVVGLDVDTNGKLYILDGLDHLHADGAVIRVLEGDTLSQLIHIPADAEIPLKVPNDIALDSDNNLYIVDAQSGQILRMLAGNIEVEIWWQAPSEDVIPVGLAYHPTRDTLLITDTGQNRIYEVPTTTADPQAETTLLYQDKATRNFPGFNGITVAPDGTVYVAALSLNQVGRLNLEQGQITYLAGAFRGSSDLAYDTQNERLFVNNWDQRWLLPVKFLFLSFKIDPHLPFSIDVLEF